MKKIKFAALLSCAILLLSFFAQATALEFKDFTDVSGHWAEKTLEKGFSDALIQGFDDETLRPDDNITGVQMITILSRVLNFPEASPSGAFPAEAWYADDAERALSLGLISAGGAGLDAPMTRQDALSLLAKAFSLVPAMPDLSVLDSYADSADIKAENRAALASLVSGGYVEGFAGSLNASSGISRAEFLAVLYRVAQVRATVSSLDSSLSGAAVVSGGGAIRSKTLSGNLWFDYKVGSVSLSSVTAKNVTILNPSLSSLSLNKSSLSSLVLSGLKGDFELSGDSSVKTLRAGSSFKAELGENVENVELAGDGADITLSGKHGSLSISGNNNTVLLSDDCALTSLSVSGSGNVIRLASKTQVGAVSIAGENNVLEPAAAEDAEGKAIIGENAVSSLKLSGSGNRITLNGSLSDFLSLDGTHNTLLLTSSEPLRSAAAEGAGNWLTLTCTDLQSLQVGGQSNTVHKAGAGIVSSVNVSGFGSAFRLYVGNSLTSMSVTGDSNSITIDGTVQALSVDAHKNTVSGAGRAEQITIESGRCEITLPYGTLIDNGYAKDADRVLALVSCNYRGNYTLEWAQEHDYEDYEKEVFVNAKGYSSKTGYLIWINLAMQRVNIFEGSKEDWKLTRSSIVSTGAPSSPTPVGIYYTTYNLERGWTTATYTCRPVVGFKANSGYAFHSRLYYPNSSTLTDATIGYPASHGCVRMYDEDVRYIFDNIPLGTAVVVF